MITTRKRKAGADDDEQHPPRKLAAIAEESQPNQPLRPTKNIPNRTGLARKTTGLALPRAHANDHEYDLRDLRDYRRHD